MSESIEIFVPNNLNAFYYDQYDKLVIECKFNAIIIDRKCQITYHAKNAYGKETCRKIGDYYDNEKLKRNNAENEKGFTITDENILTLLDKYVTYDPTSGHWTSYRWQWQINNIESKTFTTVDEFLSFASNVCNIRISLNEDNSIEASLSFYNESCDIYRTEDECYDANVKGVVRFK